MAGLQMKIEQELRLCKVKGRLGYFHTWEHYSQPLPASPMIGGEPAGVYSQVFGIVEFPEGVEQVFPYDIKFCDETNQLLRTMQEGNNGSEAH